MGKREEEELMWEMINFELGETLEYLKDLKGVWRKLSSENRKLILHIVSGSLPDFNTADKPDFIKKYKNAATPELLAKIWEYGSRRWNDGYNQGKYDPDFD